MERGEKRSTGLSDVKLGGLEAAAVQEKGNTSWGRAEFTNGPDKKIATMKLEILRIRIGR